VGSAVSLDLPSRALVEKLVVAQLLKKFSNFYGTRMFITVFTRMRDLIISYAR